MSEQLKEILSRQFNAGTRVTSGQDAEEAGGVVSMATGADWRTALAPYGITTPEEAVAQLKLAHEAFDAQQKLNEKLQRERKGAGE